MRFLSIPIVLASLAITAFGVIHYPLSQLALGLALSAYAVVLWVRPESWLFFIPAILPIANLSPWSGWIFFEELDLFVLVTMAVGYLRLMPENRIYCLSPVASLLLMLLSVSYGVSAWIGVMPLQSLDANAFSNYFSHYNSLRILKPFVWALLLLPLMRRSEEGLFFRGLLAGLAFVSLAGIWERLAFTGLMDFSNEYRITAPFPEMHTGGAALDAFLALSLPFAVFNLFCGKRPVLALLLIVAATYVAFVTFSRGLYLGYALSVAAMGFFMLWGNRKEGGRFSLFLAVVLAVAFILLLKSFETGGYRGLAAAACMMAATYFVGGGKKVRGIAAPTIILGMACLVLIGVFGKGSYLAFALATAVCAAGFSLHGFGRDRSRGMVFATAGFLVMGPSAVAVNWHWGGGQAAVYGILVWAVAMVLALGNRSIEKPLWTWSKNGAMAAALGLMFVGMAIPVLWNPYMNSRLQDTHSDMHVRTEHWHSVIGMMDMGWKAKLFGMGLGRYPDIYFWRNGKQDFPGTYQIESGKDGPYLRLEGSKYKRGFGDFLHLGQRVDVEPYRTYTLEFDARNTFPGMRLNAEICEKYLLYEMPWTCPQLVEELTPDGQWHSYKAEMKSGKMGSAPWFERPTTQFSIANEHNGGYIDVMNVRLLDESGRDLLHNGDFSRGTDRWFFSSDFDHLQWQMENLGISLYFDQGIFGLVSFGLTILYALIRLGKLALRGDMLSAAKFASLLGFLMVGLFDSILDLQRLSLLFYLVLCSSLLLPLRDGLVKLRKMA